MTDHPIPFFCPKSLVEYSSMEQPDWMEYLGRRERLRIKDVEIEQGDGSRRLNQEELGKAWVVNSPDYS
jgi:hypothetical protein